MSDLLIIQEASKSYERLQAVNNVSLTVPQGRIVGLIGPNGSGKSTLFKMIAGSERVDAGRISFQGQDITNHSPDEIFTRGVVRSYQDPALFFRMTVLDNALFPVRSQRGERASLAPFHHLWRRQEKEIANAAGRLLEQFGLRRHFAFLASDLSGGQMKLLELARCLNGAPQLLLLDEPTAGVAPKLAHDIFRQIEEARTTHGLTFFVIEHRLEVLFEFVDEVYVMHAGCLVAHGTPAQVAADARVREIYFGD
jgi:branched-chain amino acid transport system ATP-binding protein